MHLISNTDQISRSKDEAMKVPNQDLSERARAYSISEFFCICKLQRRNMITENYTQIGTDPESLEKARYWELRYFFRR